MIEFKLDLKGVDKDFAQLRKNAANLRDAFMSMKKEITDSIRDHFVSRAGSYGAWAPRAQSSIERLAGRRMRVQGGTLSARAYNARGGWMKRTKVSGKKFKWRMANQLGRLKYAFKYTAAARYVEIRSLVAWSAIHQEGGHAGKGGRSAIPQREFLWLPDEIIAALGREIIHTISRYLVKY